MIYITQLIYLKEGQENVFEQFECIAIPIIAKYRGRLLLRIRPERDAYIESKINIPYEIHLIEFVSDEYFMRFMQDEERKRFLHLKDQSFETVLLIKGEKL